MTVAESTDALFPPKIFHEDTQAMGFLTRQSTCEEHGDCIVVYTHSRCPICEMQEDLDSVNKDIAYLEDRLSSEKEYVEELVNDLEKFRYPPAQLKQENGRVFQEESD